MAVHASSKPADEASRLPAAAWLVLGIVLVADVMDLLDSTITTIAAPTISSSLHGGPGLIKWLGASYALALGVLLVTGGRLGDKYGRRRIFLIGIAGFTAASLACGLAWDPPSIIVARLVQGAFGGLLIPQGFGILGSVFPREHIGKAFSAFGALRGQRLRAQCVRRGLRRAVRGRALSLAVSCHSRRRSSDRFVSREQSRGGWRRGCAASGPR
jgi:hypothetical protein